MIRLTPARRAQMFKALDPYEMQVSEAVKNQQVREELQHLKIVEHIYWERTTQCATEATRYAKLAVQAAEAIARLSASVWQEQNRKTL